MTRAYTRPLNPAGARPREISERVNAILRGKINSVGALSLTPNSLTTTLHNEAIGIDSGIIVSPMTASAHQEGIPWFQVTEIGALTLNHASNTQTDRTYFYLIVG